MPGLDMVQAWPDLRQEVRKWPFWSFSPNFWPCQKFTQKFKIEKCTLFSSNQSPLVTEQTWPPVRPSSKTTSKTPDTDRAVVSASGGQSNSNWVGGARKILKSRDRLGQNSTAMTGHPDMASHQNWPDVSVGAEILKMPAIQVVKNRSKSV